MCERYVINQTAEQLLARLKAQQAEEDIHPRFNAAPGQYLPLITEESPQEIQMMKWGLVPNWATNPAMGATQSNIKLEVITKKPEFHPLMAARRCLVPMSGYYLWQKVSKSQRIPYYLSFPGQDVVCVAGLYDEWADEDGTRFATFGLITGAANALVERFESRMPIILKPEDEAAWLDPDKRLGDVLPLLSPYPADAMTWWEVSPLVNNPRKEGRELIRQYKASFQASLFR